MHDPILVDALRYWETRRIAYTVSYTHLTLPTKA